MHEKIREHHPIPLEKNGETISEMEKLKKMAEHWIAHNEEHARSYRLWANRAKEAGREETGEILEDIAGEMLDQNRKLERIVFLLGL
jgi:hemerythrin superfamily protein